MPLHLLGKKSWNVYNADNIARVKRDEAAAAAQVEADEQRMQEEDAERRIRLLRGETVPAAESRDQVVGDACQASPHDAQVTDHRRTPAEQSTLGNSLGHLRKRRKLRGEDETDMEMRLAREDQAQFQKQRDELGSVGRGSVQDRSGSQAKHHTIDAPIVDTRGHIDLFPQARNSEDKEKNGSGTASRPNKEAESERRRKELDYEDQYTMRFSNAAGNRTDISARAWYEHAETKVIEAGNANSHVTGETSLINPHTKGSQTLGSGFASTQVGRDVWGNADPRRLERDAQRVAHDDPLAMINQGVQGVRRAAEERKAWMASQAQEMADLPSLDTTNRLNGENTRHGDRSYSGEKNRHSRRRHHRHYKDEHHDRPTSTRRGSSERHRDISHKRRRSSGLCSSNLDHVDIEPRRRGSMQISSLRGQKSDDLGKADNLSGTSRYVPESDKGHHRHKHPSDKNNDEQAHDGGSYKLHRNSERDHSRHDERDRHASDGKSSLAKRSRHRHHHRHHRHHHDGD